MRTKVRAIAVLALCGCAEQQPLDDGSDPAPVASVVEYEGLATRLLWSQVGTMGYEIYRPTSPSLFQVGIEYDEEGGTVTFPQTCVFPVEATESTLAAKDETCVFPEDSDRPNEEIRSQDVNEFRYDLSTTRFVLSSTGERRIVEGEYGLVYELLQGVLGDGDELLKYPSGATGYEYADARMYTFQPKAFDDDSGCSESTQHQSDYADGIVVLEESGNVVLSGWGCSSDLRGVSDEPVPCDYVVEPPAPVPRLWLSQLELSDAGFLMKGELRGADYTYCVELEADAITRL